MKKVIIVGGDKRQEKLCDILTTRGHSCQLIDCFLKSEVSFRAERNDIIILPVPVSKDGESIYSSNEKFHMKIKDVLNSVNSTNLIFGGNFSEDLSAYLEENDVPFFDYLKCDELTVYNAYLTGVGALKLLLENTEEEIKDRKVLVTGFGRVAKFTAKALKDVGCDVCVTARNNTQLTEAECVGYKSVEFKDKSSFLHCFDYIFNTVPENIFTFEDVNNIKGLYFELASSPFGVPSNYFAEKSKKYVFGGSLPGRFFSLSAAEKLADITVKQINKRDGGD